MKTFFGCVGVGRVAGDQRAGRQSGGPTPAQLKHDTKKGIGDYYLSCNQALQRLSHETGSPFWFYVGQLRYRYYWRRIQIFLATAIPRSSPHSPR